MRADFLSWVIIFSMEDRTFDVVIIGAGISGACIARELSKKNASILLLDKENDVACGCTKANSGIVHAGYDPEPGTLMAKLNVRGASLMKQYSSVLDFDYQEIGSLVLAFDEDGDQKVKELFERGKKNGVQKLAILSGDEVRAMEKNVSEAVTSALYAPTAAIISPYQAAWVFSESAVINGVQFLRNTKVHAIEKVEEEKVRNGGFVLKTSHGDIKTRFVVNAAGLYAGEISRMAGAKNYSILQRRGEYSLLDSSVSSLVSHVLFQTPGKMGKGVLVTKTVDGNILIGPGAQNLAEKTGDDALYSTSTTDSMQKEILKKARDSVPEIPTRSLINSFAGIRAIALDENQNEEKDFIIEEDPSVKGFVNVGGICSPGLTSAPAIAEMVRDILVESGLDCEDKTDFIEERRGIPSFKASEKDGRIALIKEEPLYSKIVCRCEMITEGEIVRAIKSPVGARDLDGVKRRVRAGMGRCQGGFCSPRVTEILSRELEIPMTSVTKKGGTSYVLDSKTRSEVPDIKVSDINVPDIKERGL